MTLHMGIGDYLNVYSIAEKKLLLSSQITFPFTDVKNEEPEGICETGPGEFLAAVSEDRNDGRRMDKPTYEQFMKIYEGLVHKAERRMKKGEN